MNNKFDEIINRRGTNCAKWDEMDEKYGRVLEHFGVADMDFKTAPEIIEDMSKILKSGVYGYTNPSINFYKSIVYWYKKRFNIDIKKEWIIHCSRITVAISALINILDKNSIVKIHMPAYTPLVNAVINNKKKLVLEELKYDKNINQYKLNHSNNNQDLLILCNPHNPTSKIFNDKELKLLYREYIKNNKIVFSDEIHSGYISKNIKFNSFIKYLESENDKIIIADSITKSFNVPGLLISYLIIPNKNLRESMKLEIERIGINNPNLLSQVALETAYSKCEYYLDELNDYIDKNIKLVEDAFNSLEGFKVINREGTYLLWIDYSKTNKTREEMEDIFINKLGSSVYFGDNFGEKYSKFIRFNVATSRIRLEEFIEKIKKYFK